MTAIATPGATLSLEIERLLNPASFYSRPRDVLDDPALSIIEKRAILSSWASDCCAVESHPDLRQPLETPAPIAFDDIMEALKELDTYDAHPPRKPLWKRYRPKKGHEGTPQLSA